MGKGRERRKKWKSRLIIIPVWWMVAQKTAGKTPPPMGAAFCPGHDGGAVAALGR